MPTDNTTSRSRSGHACCAALCALVMLCWLIAGVPTPTRPDYDGAHPRYSKQEIHRAIAWYAKYRLDPALLRAVIKTESDFRQHAVSRKGAVGLMQPDARYRGHVACEGRLRSHPEYPRRC